MGSKFHAHHKKKSNSVEKTAETCLFDRARRRQLPCYFNKALCTRETSAMLFSVSRPVVGEKKTMSKLIPNFILLTKFVRLFSVSYNNVSTSRLHALNSCLRTTLIYISDRSCLHSVNCNRQENTDACKYRPYSWVT